LSCIPVTHSRMRNRISHMKKKTEVKIKHIEKPCGWEDWKWKSERNLAILCQGHMPGWSTVGFTSKE
jgi:hypothetical protein